MSCKIKRWSYCEIAGSKFNSRVMPMGSRDISGNGLYANSELKGIIKDVSVEIN